MDYRTVKLEDYNLKLDVGIIPHNELGVFLSRVEVSDGSVSQQEWEKFLLDSLIKNTDTVMAVAGSITKERDKTLLRYQIVEAIYKLNNRLKPQNIVVSENKLLHVSDAVRNNVSTTITLISNPRWSGETTDVDTLVDSSYAEDVLEVAWEKVKQLQDRNYIKEYVQIIDIDVPILEVESMSLTLDDVVRDFIVRRCQGDIDTARTGNRIWIAHILSLVIPDADKFAYALSRGGYMNLYTEHILMTQLYLAATKVNPSLDWNNIDWDKILAENEDDDGDECDGCDSCTPVRSAVPSINDRRILPLIKINRRDNADNDRTRSKNKSKSSREEAEAERPKFSDVGFDTILGLNDRMQKRVIGQDNALAELAESILLARVGLKDLQKPIGCFLLPGPTGVGKTETAKVLADELGFYLAVQDCSEFQSAHEVSKIFGAPPGYVGFEDASKPGQESAPPLTLAAKLRKYPMSVVLFDEIEKADPAIFNVLLQMMDEGRITSGRGDIISLADTVILMTSNIGVDEAAKTCSKNRLGFGEECFSQEVVESQIIERNIKDTFKPEFLNRLTNILYYKSLKADDCNKIADLLLDKTKKNLEKAQHMTMVWDNIVAEHIVEKGFSQEYGARNLARTVKKIVEVPLARWLLDKAMKSGGEGGATVDFTKFAKRVVKVALKDSGIIFSWKKEEKSKKIAES